MNRKQRRKSLQLAYKVANQSATMHNYDDDGVCRHCGFDGAEYEHLYQSIPVESRGERSDQSRYCF